MRHNEQSELVQKVLFPGSPRLHFLFVPCHRWRSLPRDLPEATKFPLASTLSLGQKIQ